MLHRTVCEVFEEMRKADQTKNYSGMLALIEEAQGMANRMEAKLWAQNDLKRLRKAYKRLSKKKKKLQKKVNRLEGKEDTNANLSI